MTKFIPLMTIAALGGALMISACSTVPNDPTSKTDIREAQDRSARHAETYSESELVAAVSTHLGVNSESAATAIERLFKDKGRPTGYITGEEGGGAFTVGARYGKGTLWLRNGTSRKVYWQGPTIGLDAGAEASKVFTLVYGLDNPEYIYQRFPGAEGTATFVAGMAISYQRANGVTLAPVRTSVGGRLGANVGYTSYTRKRSLIPL